MIGIAPHLGRQIERDRQARLAIGKQVAIAAIRFFRITEAGVLTHRPQPPAIHRGLDAARERIIARETQIVQEIEAIEVFGIVLALDLDSRRGGEMLAPLATAFERRGDAFRLPALARLAYRGAIAAMFRRVFGFGHGMIASLLNYKQKVALLDGLAGGHFNLR